MNLPHHPRPSPHIYRHLGLRVRRGCSFHGLALNVAVDLAPFAGINPCGYAGLEMTRLADLGGPGSVARVAGDMKPHLLRAFGYPQPAGGRAGSG